MTENKKYAREEKKGKGDGWRKKKKKKWHKASHVKSKHSTFISFTLMINVMSPKPKVRNKCVTLCVISEYAKGYCGHSWCFAHVLQSDILIEHLIMIKQSSKILHPN